MPWTDTYKLGFREPVMKQRYHNYRAGLMDPWEIAVLYQDLVEAECVPAMLLEHALHFIQMRLVSVPEQFPCH